MFVNHDVHPCYAGSEKEFLSLLSSHEVSEPCSHSEQPSSTQWPFHPQFPLLENENVNIDLMGLLYKVHCNEILYKPKLCKFNIAYK